MSNKTELRRLVDLIKHRAGITQADIADRAGYKRTYLSEALSKDKPPEKLLTKLKLTFADILETEHKQTSEKTEGQEGGLKPSTKHAPKSVTDDLIHTLHAWLQEKDKLIAEKDRVIAEKERLLKINSNFVQVRINSVLAYSQTLYELMLERIAKDERKKVIEVRDKFGQRLADTLQEIVSMGIVD